MIIDEADMPRSVVYRRRFGSLTRAYRLVGYISGRDNGDLEVNRALRRLHADVVGDVVANVERRGGSVLHDSETDLLTINGEFTSSIVVARCTSTPSGATRWKFRLDTGLRPDITVALRMAPENRQALDYYLLPRIDVSAPRLRLARHNGISLDAYRFDSLAHFFQISARTHLRLAI